MKDNITCHGMFTVSSSSLILKRMERIHSCQCHIAHHAKNWSLGIFMIVSNQNGRPENSKSVLTNNLCVLMCMTKCEEFFLYPSPCLKTLLQSKNDL